METNLFETFIKKRIGAVYRSCNRYWKKRIIFLENKILILNVELEEFKYSSNSSNIFKKINFDLNHENEILIEKNSVENSVEIFCSIVPPVEPPDFPKLNFDPILINNNLQNMEFPILETEININLNIPLISEQEIIPDPGNIPIFIKKSKNSNKNKNRNIPEIKTLPLSTSVATREFLEPEQKNKYKNILKDPKNLNRNVMVEPLVENSEIQSSTPVGDPHIFSYEDLKIVDNIFLDLNNANIISPPENNISYTYAEKTRIIPEITLLRNSFEYQLNFFKINSPKIIQKDFTRHTILQYCWIVFHQLCHEENPNYNEFFKLYFSKWQKETIEYMFDKKKRDLEHDILIQNAQKDFKKPRKKK